MLNPTIFVYNYSCNIQLHVCPGGMLCGVGRERGGAWGTECVAERPF